MLLLLYSGTVSYTHLDVYKRQSPRYETIKALERVFGDSAESRSFDTAYDPHGKCNLKVSDALAPYLTKQQGEYTVEDYYALPDDVRVELIDGVIYDMTAPTTIHPVSYTHLKSFPYRA